MRRGGRGKAAHNLPPGKDSSGKRVQTLLAQKGALQPQKGGGLEDISCFLFPFREAPLSRGSYRRRRKAGMSKLSLSKAGTGNSLILELSVIGCRFSAALKPVAMTVI